MSKFANVLFGAIGISLFLLGCNDDGSETQEDGVFKGLSYKTLDAGDLSFTDDEVKGTGKFVFTDPLSGVESNNHYAFSFQLDDGQSVTLFSNADSEGKNGIEFSIERAGESAEWKLIFGEVSVDIDSSFSSIDVTKEIKIALDVHNKEDPSHILIWNGENTEFTESNVLFNSSKESHEEDEHNDQDEEDGHDEGHEHEESKSPGKGTGTFWGFSLKGATLKNSSVQAAKIEEH